MMKPYIKLLPILLSTVFVFNSVSCKMDSTEKQEKTENDILMALLLAYATRPTCKYTESDGSSHTINKAIAADNSKVLYLTLLEGKNTYAGAIEITAEIGDVVTITYRSGDPGYDFMLDQHCPIDAATANNAYTAYTAVYTDTGAEYTFSVAGNYTLIYQSYTRSSIKVLMR